MIEVLGEDGGPVMPCRGCGSLVFKGRCLNCGKVSYTLDEVSSCTRCPFALVEAADSTGHFEVRCGHGAFEATGGRLVSRTVKSAGDAAPPEWCPLRSAPTVVRLAKGI